MTDGGFPDDPEGYKGEIYNSDLVTLKDIARFNCLILLGEPGLGKTQTLKVEQTVLSEALKRQGHSSLFINLGEYGSEDRLVRELFSSPEFSLWEQGSHQLHIFLDSFDECLLKVDTLADILVKGFSHYKNSAKRLYLRIACRTAIWPVTLEENFSDIWKKDCVSVYELVPLRRVDIVEAVSTEQLSSDVFLRKVQDKNLVSLAIKPVTLQFLISIYKRSDEKFPASQSLHELYLEGCKTLCTERKDERRHYQKSVSNLEVEQRLMVAGRIAAMTVFANRFAIWTGSSHELLTEDVLLKNLCKGYEVASDRRFEISEKVVKEVLNTGLFSSRGPNRMGWAHKTYSEFLSAWYLKAHQLPLSKILNLIVHPGDPAKRVIPQLQETIAWLASTDSKIFSKVMETDPDVLLLSDLAATDLPTKASLVKSLLKTYDEGKLQYQYRYRIFKNLQHPGLPTQLIPYIDDDKKGLYSRYVAIDIAEICHVSPVQSNLVTIALDEKQPYNIRVRAASAVSRIGDDKTKAKLKSLALNNKKDPDNSLKGLALKSVYPERMTTVEALNCLTQTRTSIIGGHYQDFIARDFGDSIPEEDLYLVLRWIKNQPARRNQGYPFGQFSDVVMMRSWERLEDPAILIEFAQIVSIRIRKYEQIIEETRSSSFRQLLEEDTCRRRILLEAVVSSIKDIAEEPYWLGRSSSTTLHPLTQDFEWLVEKSKNADSEAEKSIYAKLVRWHLNWNSAEQISLLLSHLSKSHSLETEFSSELEPAVLGSQKAKREREKYYENQKIFSHNNDSGFKKTSPTEIVLDYVEQLEQGLIDAWWHMCKGREPDFTKLSGWKEADESLRLRVIAAAKEYVQRGNPEANLWLGQSKISYPAQAGYIALRLIAEKDVNFTSSLPPHIWEKWMCIILDDRWLIYDEDRDIRKYILQEAQKKAEPEFIKVLDIAICYADSQGHPLSILNEVVQHCWGAQLEKYLTSKLTNKSLNISSYQDILKGLLINEVKSAKSLSEQHLSFSLSSSETKRRKAVTAAQMLILYSADAAWSSVWNAIEQDATFGKTVFEEIAFQLQYECRVEKKLSANEIADLYIFLFNQYSSSDDVIEDDSDTQSLVGPKAYIAGPIDSLINWRNSLPQKLQELGTENACEALYKIIRELPELEDSIQWRLIEAESLARRQSWHPPSPLEVFQLIVTPEPTRLQLSNQIKDMSEEPKFDVSGSNNIIQTGKGSSVEQKNEIKEDSTSNRLAWWVSTILAILGICFSGFFNNYAKQLWNNRNFSPEVIEALPENKERP